MKKLNLFLLVLFICNCPVVSGYAFFDRDIRLLTMQDGLADNTITSIYKDRDGFMWFGTNNGLSRYDGKLIKNFSSIREVFYLNLLLLTFYFFKSFSFFLFSKFFLSFLNFFYFFRIFTVYCICWAF